MTEKGAICECNLEKQFKEGNGTTQESCSPFLFHHFFHIPHLSYLENTDHGCMTGQCKVARRQKSEQTTEVPHQFH